jgi:hypothetical protein
LSIFDINVDENMVFSHLLINVPSRVQITRVLVTIICVCTVSYNKTCVFELTLLVQTVLWVIQCFFSSLEKIPFGDAAINRQSDDKARPVFSHFTSERNFGELNRHYFTVLILGLRLIVITPFNCWDTGRNMIVLHDTDWHCLFQIILRQYNSRPLQHQPCTHNDC